MVKRSPAAGVVVFILLLAVLLAPPYAAAAVPPQDILIVHSYHQGFLWTDNVMAGMLDVFQKEAPDAQIHVEYLDAKRYPHETFVPILTETLIRKTSRLKPKVILVSDDAAFDFMLSLRSEFFPGVPLVFCGVNNFKDEHLAGQIAVTGVVEDFDIKSTIDVILTLHRQATHLAVISDSTETGLANRERFRKVAPIFAARLKFLELFDLSTEELDGKLKMLPPDAIILNLSFFRDRLGKNYSTQDGNKLIASRAGRPIYSCWDFYLVGDVVGGYMTSGRQQGEAAASMVAAILRGSRANDIPILRTSPNAYMFDYNVMERFGIKESALPKGSVVLNHQVSVLEQYWGWLLGFVVIAVLQTFLIVTLLTRGKRLRAANAALQDSEVQFKAMVETVPMAIHLTTGVEQITQYVNPTMVKLFGYTQEEIPSVAQWWPLAYPDASYRKQVAEEWTRRVQRAIDTQSPIEPMEVVVHCKDGSEKNISWGYITLGDKNYSCGLDLTERKRAEEALRESEERLRAIFQAARNVSFIITDMEDPVPNILEFSPGAETIFRYDKSEVIGKPVSILHLPQDVVKFPQAHEQMRHGVTGFSGETTLVRKSGEQFPALFSTYPLFDLHGEVYAGLGVSFDISEKQKLETQLLQAQKMESVGRLAGGVAHDFNNMLSVILGHTEIALEETDSASPLHASLQAVQQAAQKSAILTRQLLAFARKQTVAPKVIDLNKTVEGMLNMLRRLIGEDIDLLWLPGKKLAPVKIDPAQIDQILANLCVNARDAIAGVGKITIETALITFDEANFAEHPDSLPGEFILLAVSDDGCGMDQETLGHLFEPFFTTKEQGKGTGLGLASVYGAVKQNNGFINVYSEPGNGTTCNIYLPKYTVKSALSEEQVEDRAAERGHETILLVEDELAILEMTTIMLNRLGYRVVAAATPGEAIRLAHEHSSTIDLLMTDVVMPEMNGRELAGNLLVHYPDLKRLFMSGYTSDVIAHHGVLDEGVHFIQKPFSKKDLGEKLREALEG